MTLVRMSKVVALQPAVKTKAGRQRDEIYKALQRVGSYLGHTRTYRTYDEDTNNRDQRFDPGQRLLSVVATQLDDLGDAMVPWWDNEATMTWGNCSGHAVADVVLDGQVFLEAVPAPYLLFLEKQLVDLHTMFAKIPVLAGEYEWQRTAAEQPGVWRSEPRRENATKKILRSMTKYEATKEHPAQTETYYEDTPVGEWTKILYSGAVPPDRLRVLLERVVTLHTAVIAARQEANILQVEAQHPGRPIFDYLLSDAA